MAFAVADSDSPIQNTSSTANQTSLVAFYTGSFAVGIFVVLIIAVDNNQTTDGDEGAVTGVSDDAGNTYTKAIEHCNGQGSAQAGATVSMWYCQLTNAVTSSNLITASFSNSASRDKSGILGRAWSVGAGNTVAVEGTPAGLSNDAADPGSLNVTTANIACLRVRGIASESNALTSLTLTGSWTTMGPPQVSTGGGSAANMSARGEFIISTATGAASDPTLFSADHASAYVAFKEVAATFTPEPPFIHRQAVRRASFY